MVIFQFANCCRVPFWGQVMGWSSTPPAVRFHRGAGVKAIQRPSNNTWTMPAIWVSRRQFGCDMLRWHKESLPRNEGRMLGDAANLWNAERWWFFSDFQGLCWHKKKSWDLRGWLPLIERSPWRGWDWRPFTKRDMMEVSWNGGTPRLSILIELSITNHPAMGVPPWRAGIWVY